MTEIESVSSESEERRQKAEEATRLLIGRQDSEIERVILFGSVARGEATPASDIDICVTYNDILTQRQVLFVSGELDQYLRGHGFMTGAHIPMGLDFTHIRDQLFRESETLPDRIRETIEAAKREGIILFQHEVQ